MRILKPLTVMVFLALPQSAALYAQDAPEEAQQAERDRSYLTGLIEDNLSGNVVARSPDPSEDDD